MSGVSFVCPVYNKAPHLPGVLQSMFAQQGDFERQYIFVDDGSTDHSRAILGDLVAGRSDVVVIDQENRGSAAATNRGLAEVRLPFVKFVDADDLLAHGATALLLDRLSERPDCVLAYGQAVTYRDESDLDLTKLPDAPAETVLAEPLRLALRNSLFNPTQFLARSDALDRSGGCDERIVFSQEYSLTLRLARLGGFLRVDAPIAFLPEHAAGRITSRGKGRQLQRVTLACAHFLRDYPDTAPALRRFALRRAAGRAWLWSRREADGGYFSAPLLPLLLSRLPLPMDHAAWVDRCAGAYDGEAEVTAAASPATRPVTAGPDGG